MYLVSIQYHRIRHSIDKQSGFIDGLVHAKHDTFTLHFHIKHPLCSYRDGGNSLQIKLAMASLRLFLRNRCVCRVSEIGSCSYRIYCFHVGSSGKSMVNEKREERKKIQ